MPLTRQAAAYAGRLGWALVLAACSAAGSSLTPARPGSPPPATSTIEPVIPLGELGLSGRIVLLPFVDGHGRIVSLDLASGAVETLFDPPAGTWVTYASVSPDGQTLAFSYAPPPGQGEIQSGFTQLYWLPMNGPGTPQPMLAGAVQGESYYNPVWSPDSRRIYYSRIVTRRDGQGAVVGSQFALERAAFPGGEPQPVAMDALWPRLSPDGERLAFVYDSLTDERVALHAAAPDGSRLTTLPLPQGFIAVDAPVFSPDGRYLYFSASEAGAASPRAWLDQWLGVRLAQAAPNPHSLPADWWRLPVDGGPAERLTRLGEMGLYGAFSPDGQRLAFITSTGLFVMDADGSGLTRILSLTMLGSVSWVE